MSEKEICPKCKGEGFYLVEDIDWKVQECLKCKGEGTLSK
jgi:DnaJ-class molecular chaperone